VAERVQKWPKTNPREKRLFQKDEQWANCTDWDSCTLLLLASAIAGKVL
jgi:hypothetical protein